MFGLSTILGLFTKAKSNSILIILAVTVGTSLYGYYYYQVNKANKIIYELKENVEVLKDANIQYGEANRENDRTIVRLKKEALAHKQVLIDLKNKNKEISAQYDELLTNSSNEKDSNISPRLSKILNALNGKVIEEQELKK